MNSHIVLFLFGPNGYVKNVDWLTGADPNTYDLLPAQWLEDEHGTRVVERKLDDVLTAIQNSLDDISDTIQDVRDSFALPDNRH